MKKWINKQLWRVTQTYRLLAPFIDITKIIMWGVITVGITQWFIVTLDAAAAIVLSAFCSLLLLGYILDKTGFLQEAGSRAFKISNTLLYMHQLNMGAAKGSIPMLRGFVDILFILNPELMGEYNIEDMKKAITTESRQTIDEEKRWFEAQGMVE